MRTGLLASLAIAGLVAGCGTAPTPPPSAVSSVSAQAGAAPATASDMQGRFRLDFELPKATYTDAEAIEGLATLSVIGPWQGTIGASGGGPMLFGVRELSGTREIGAAADAACGAFDIGDGAPITSPIKKTGGWDPQAPDAAFYQAFFRDPQFRLPVGTWQITAYAAFAEGADCGGPSHDLRAPIQIQVTAAP